MNKEAEERVACSLVFLRTSLPSFCMKQVPFGMESLGCQHPQLFSHLGATYQAWALLCAPGILIHCGCTRILHSWDFTSATCQQGSQEQLRSPSVSDPSLLLLALPSSLTRVLVLSLCHFIFSFLGPLGLEVPPNIPL
jgi:hypothetical protein